MTTIACMRPRISVSPVCQSTGDRHERLRQKWAARVTRMLDKRDEFEARRVKQLWNIAKALDEVVKAEVKVLDPKTMNDKDGDIEVAFVDVDAET